MENIVLCLQFARPRISLLLCAVAFMALSSIVKVGLPVLLQNLLEAKETPASWEYMWIIMVYGVYHVTSMLGHYLCGKINALIVGDVTRHICGKLCRTKFVIVSSELPEELSVKINTAANAASDTITGIVTDVFHSSIHLLFFTAGIVHYSPKLLSLVLVSVALNYGLTKILRKELPALCQRRVHADAVVVKDVSHVVRYQSTLRLFSSADVMLGKLDQSIIEACKLAASVSWLVHGTQCVRGLSGNIVYVFMVGMIRHLRDTGVMSVGDVLVFMYYMTQWQSYFSDTMSELSKLFATGGKLETLKKTLQLEEEIARDLPSRDQVLVELKDAHYSHGIRGVTMKCHLGGLYGIVGRNGEGKTTLMRMIARLIPPTSGSIVACPAILCEQEAPLLPISIRENIRLGNRHATDDEITSVAKKCMVHDLIESLPNQYDTIVTLGGAVSLSGGQIQKIVLARVFLSNRAVVLFDEPTKGLDGVTASAIMKLLMDLSLEGRAVFVATHVHGDVLKRATEIFILRSGRIERQGTYNDLEHDLTQLMGT